MVRKNPYTEKLIQNGEIVHEKRLDDSCLCRDRASLSNQLMPNWCMQPIILMMGNPSLSLSLVHIHNALSTSVFQCLLRLL